MRQQSKISRKLTPHQRLPILFAPQPWLHSVATLVGSRQQGKMAIISERLQTLAIKAVDNDKLGNMSFLTSTLMRIASFKSHKILCRKL